MKRELTYHKDIGLPRNFEKPLPGMLLNYSNHSIRRAEEKGFVLLDYLPRVFDIVEVELLDNQVTKWVVRFSVSGGWDMVLVVQPNGFVRTAWQNESTDRHRTLDRSKYARVQQEAR